MGSKRISVPEFDEFLPASTGNQKTKLPTGESEALATGYRTEAPEASEQANASGKKSLTDMLGMFFNTKEEVANEEKPLEIVSSKTFLNTFNGKKQEIQLAPDSHPMEDALDGPVEDKKIKSLNSSQASFQNRAIIETPKVNIEDKGFGTFKISGSEQKNYNAKPRQGKTLTEDEAIKQIKSLNIWSKPPSLKCLTIGSYSDYYYVMKDEGLGKIGNNFVFDKTSGQIYVIASTLPPQIVLKKIVNQEIKPTY